jgi:MarR family transcriptional regulator, lower aerobic nicotinate degradation pathway regulator
LVALLYFVMTVTEPITTPKLRRFPRELVDSTAFLIKRLGFQAKERALDAYAPTGLGPYHHAVLIALDEGAPETQGAIADTLGYDKGQLVGLLDELEEQHLVERRRDPNDRRRHVVRLTPEGRKALGRFRTLSRKIEDDLLAPLDEREREQLHALMLKLAQHHLPRCQALTPDAD